MASLIETAVAVRRHRKHLEDRPMFCKLGPPEAFSDELATERDFQRLCNGLDPALTGPRADAVRWRIVSSCAGWETRPTTEEFYAAVRAANPTRRQRAIVLMWATEATLWEILEAWAQRAYTIRQLVRAMHLAHFDYPDRIREINQWAEVGRYNGQEIWNA